MALTVLYDGSFPIGLDPLVGTVSVVKKRKRKKGDRLISIIKTYSILDFSFRSLPTQHVLSLASNLSTQLQAVYPPFLILRINDKSTLPRY